MSSMLSNIQLTCSLCATADFVYDVNIISVQIRIAYVTKRCSSVYWLWCNRAYPSLHTQTWVSSKWPLYCVNGVCHNFSCTLVSLAACWPVKFQSNSIYHHLLIDPKITVPSFWSTILSTSIFYAFFFFCVWKYASIEHFSLH